jgi:hypothetical protein
MQVGQEKQGVVITIPEPYKANTPRDDLVLEYIDTFRRQFVQLYPERPKLFLHPKNEHGAEVPLSSSFPLLL